MNEIRPHMNVNNEAYHMHEIMFMEKFDHKYIIVQKLITCKTLTKLKFSSNFQYKLNLPCMNILMFTNVPYRTYNLTTWKLDDS